MKKYIIMCEEDIDDISGETTEVELSGIKHDKLCYAVEERDKAKEDPKYAGYSFWVKEVEA